MQRGSLAVLIYFLTVYRSAERASSTGSEVQDTGKKIEFETRQNLS
jgi:hypothetical protein